MSLTIEPTPSTQLTGLPDSSASEKSAGRVTMQNLLAEDQTRPHPSELTRRAAVEEANRTLLQTMRHALALAMTEEEFQEYEYHFDSTKNGKEVYSSVCELVGHWSEIECPSEEIRGKLIARIWNSLFAILGEASHAWRSSSSAAASASPYLARGRGRDDDASRMSDAIDLLKTFALVIFESTPTPEAAERVFRRREVQLRCTNARSIKKRQAMKKGKHAASEKEDEIEEHISLVKFTPPPPPTKAQRDAIFHHHEPFMLELFQTILELLGDCSFEDRSLLNDVIQSLLATETVRDWLFTRGVPEREAVVRSYLELGYTLAGEKHQLDEWQKEQLQEYLSDPTNTSYTDPRIETEDMNRDGLPASLSMGRSVLQWFIGFASETEGGKDGWVAICARDLGLQVLRALKEGTEKLEHGGWIPEDYELRAAIVGLQQVLVKTPNAEQIGLVTSELLQEIFEILYPLLMEEKTNYLILRAGFAFLKCMVAFSIDTFQRTALRMIDSILIALPSASVHMKQKLELLCVMRQFVDLVPNDRWSDQKTNGKLSLPNVLFNLLDDTYARLDSPEAKEDLQIEEEETSVGDRLVVCIVDHLNGIAVCQDVEVNNRFKPYGLRLLTAVLEILEKTERLRPCLMVTEIIKIQVWRSICYGEGLTLLPRFHSACVRIMLMEDRCKNGALSDVTIRVRAGVMLKWHVLVNHFRGDFQPYIDDCVKFMLRLMGKRYHWPVETRKEKLEARKRRIEERKMREAEGVEGKDGHENGKSTKPKKKQQMMDEETEVDEATVDEKKVGDHAAAEAEIAEIEDADDGAEEDDEDDVYEGEDDEVADEAEDEDNDDDDDLDVFDDDDDSGIVYRSRYPADRDESPHFVRLWASLCEHIGSVFQSTHEKVLTPELIRWMPTGSAYLVRAELYRLIRVQPFLYGYTVFQLRALPFGEHIFPVSKLGPNTKTLITKMRSDPNRSSLADTIRYNDPQDAEEMFNTLDQLLDTIGVGMWEIGGKQKSLGQDEPGDADWDEPMPHAPLKQRRTAKAFQAGAYHRVTNSKPIKGSAGGASRMGAEKPVDHSLHIRQLISDILFAVRGGAPSSVYRLPRENPDEDPIEDDQENDFMRQLVKQGEQHHQLQQEEHTCNHRCLSMCKISDTMDMCSSALRTLGSLAKAVGDWFIHHREDLLSIWRTIQAMMPLPLYRGPVTWFIGDLCDALTHGTRSRSEDGGGPIRVIPQWCIDEVLAPGFEFILSTVDREWYSNLNSDYFTRTCGILALSDFLVPDCLLPVPWLAERLIRVLPSIEKHVNQSLEHIHSYQRRRGLDWNRQEENNPARTCAHGLENLASAASTMSTSVVATGIPTPDPTSPTDLRLIGSPSRCFGPLGTHLDECAHALECIIRFQPLIEHATSLMRQSVSSTSPDAGSTLFYHHLIELFVRSLPLRSETSSSDQIYQTAACIANQRILPSITQDRCLESLKWALARHEHDGTLDDAKTIPAIKKCLQQHHRRKE